MSFDEENRKRADDNIPYFELSYFKHVRNMLFNAKARKRTHADKGIFELMSFPISVQSATRMKNRNREDDATTNRAYFELRPFTNLAKRDPP